MHPQDFAPNYQIPLTIHDFHNLIMYYVVSGASYHHLALPITSFSTLLSALENSPVEATGPGSLILGFLLEKRSREESEDGALTPLAPSLRDCLRLAASLDGRSLLLSSTLLLHESILRHSEISAFPVLPSRPRSDQSSEPASPGILALPYTPPHLYN